MKEETEKPHLRKDRHQEVSQLHNKGESGNVYNKVTRSNTKHHKLHDTTPIWKKPPVQFVPVCFKTYKHHFHFFKVQHNTQKYYAT